MKKRTRIVDRKFQLRTTFSIIGIIVIALIAVIAVTGTVLSDNNRRIMTAIQILSSKDAASPAASADTVALMRDLINRNRMVITAMIIITVALSVALYYYLINLTSRISGPIYVLSRHIRDIMEGRRPDMRKLRKNDEFKDFYEQFSNLVRRISGE
jgi:hypothetical protein